MPAPTMKATLLSDVRTTRVALYNMKPLTDESGNSHEPTQLVITERLDDAARYVSVRLRSLGDATLRAWCDDRRMAVTGDLRQMPELIRALVIAHRPDLEGVLR